MRAEERIAELDALVERQREQIAVLLAQVCDLEARLAKDSHTSGKPPASDGLARKTRSLRKHSGKKPGGQLGHRGERLRLEVVPDEVIAHRPPVCAASRQQASRRRQAQEAGARGLCANLCVSTFLHCADGANATLVTSPH